MATRNIHRPGYRGLRGYYPSRKAGRTVAFESRLERDHFLLLDADPEVVSFEEQPVTIGFAGELRPRHYTPDCRVTYRSGAVELVEVKYAEDLATMEPEARAKLDEAHSAARTWCDECGWRFVLRTDREIVGPRLDRAVALHAFARRPGVAVSVDTVLAVVLDRPGISLLELEASQSVAVRSIALHLVWLGRLRDEPFAAPSDATKLFPLEASQ